MFQILSVCPIYFPCLCSPFILHCLYSQYTPYQPVSMPHLLQILQWPPRRSLQHSHFWRLSHSQPDRPGSAWCHHWWALMFENNKKNPGSGLTKLFIALGWGLFNLRSSKYVQSWKTSCPPSCDFAWVSDMKHKDHMGPWRVQVAASLPNDSCTQSCSGMKSCWIQLITWNRPTDPH